LYHYREQWLAAYMESQISDPNKRANALSELQSMGYTVTGLDINQASRRWQILEGGRFMPSFQTVKGVGLAAIDEIMRNRPYETVYDLLWTDEGKWRHSKFNKRAMANLIKVRAFDSMNIVGPGKTFENYAQMHEVVIEHWGEIKHVKKGRARFEELLIETRNMPGWSARQAIENKMELMGQFDLDLIIRGAVKKRLSELSVRSIDEIEDGQKGVHWFVLVDSTLKYTRKAGKPYLLLTVAGASGKQCKVFLWGAKETTSLPKYSACIADVEKNDFGCSTSMAKLRIIGRKRHK
jgi:DNA polymerase III alpha subunit